MLRGVVVTAARPRRRARDVRPRREERHGARHGRTAGTRRRSYTASFVGLFPARRAAVRDPREARQPEGRVLRRQDGGARCRRRCSRRRIAARDAALDRGALAASASRSRVLDSRDTAADAGADARRRGEIAATRHVRDERSRARGRARDAADERERPVRRDAARAERPRTPSRRAPRRRARCPRPAAARRRCTRCTRPGFRVQLARGAARHDRAGGGSRDAGGRRSCGCTRHAMTSFARRSSRDALARAGLLVEVSRRAPRVRRRRSPTTAAQVQRGSLFVAVRGAERDGHDFLAIAAERGRAARRSSRIASRTTLPALVVTRRAPRGGRRRGRRTTASRRASFGWSASPARTARRPRSACCATCSTSRGRAQRVDRHARRAGRQRGRAARRAAAASRRPGRSSCSACSARSCDARRARRSRWRCRRTRSISAASTGSRSTRPCSRTSRATISTITARWRRTSRRRRGSLDYLAPGGVGRDQRRRPRVGRAAVVAAPRARSALRRGGRRARAPTCATTPRGSDWTLDAGGDAARTSRCR